MPTRTSRSGWASPASCLVLLVWGGNGLAQQPPNVEPTPPAVVPITPSVLTPPAPATIDQLIERLEQIRRQKAEIERQEQAVVTEIQAALKKQRERLARLGIEGAPPPRPSGSALPPPELPKPEPR
jgi:hypothetical protein